MLKKVFKSIEALQIFARILRIQTSFNHHDYSEYVDSSLKIKQHFRNALNDGWPLASNVKHSFEIGKECSASKVWSKEQLELNHP